MGTLWSELGPIADGAASHPRVYAYCEVDEWNATIGFSRAVEAFARIYDGLGSRLHREEDGRFVAIAEWPDYETWRRAFDAKMVYEDKEARALFVDAIAETPPGNKPAFTMEVTDDLLARTGGLGSY